MPIDPKLMIDFAVVAEEGSFTRAALRLRVAQPWLSARIRKLEAILGYRLFDRTTRSVSLTRPGRELLEAAREVARAAEAADRLVRHLGRTDQNVLRIGAPPYSKIIQERRDLIAAFTLAHPRVSLEIEMGWSLALLARLDRGDIELAFIMGDADAACVESVVLKRFGIALSVNRAHPWANAASIPPEAMAGRAVELFVRNLNPGLWDALYAPLVKAGARLVEVPELAESAPDRMSPDAIAAYFDFGPDDAGAPDVARIPLASSPTVAFRLVRHMGPLSRAGEAFWRFACLQDETTD